MTTEHKDFEVISNSDNSEYSNDKSENSKVIGQDEYSQNDHTFMFELYRENRKLLEQIAEKNIKNAKLEERVVYLANSNVFWLCCYIGSSVIGIFSLIHH